MEPLSLIVLGGLLALDETSLGQFMVSRPIVAGALAGWLLGDPLTGFAVGGVIECLYLPRLHVGGARFPDGVPAAVTAAAVSAHAPDAGTLAIAVVAGLVVGELGGRTIVMQRRLLGRVVPERGDPEITPGKVERSHLLAVSLDGLRGAVVTAVGIGLMAPLATALAAASAAPGRSADQLTASALWILAALGAGMLWRGRAWRARDLAFLAAGAAAAIGVLA